VLEAVVVAEVVLATGVEVTGVVGVKAKAVLAVGASVRLSTGVCCVAIVRAVSLGDA
jgi:hypothetical protein